MNNHINDKDYIDLTPFKGWVLQNFPFIEADFDAITNYQLYCKIVEYLNNVISNQNQVQDLGTELVTAYNQLLDYVNNYFDNLDVQDEINNKLDAMVTDGTMDEIINQEIFGQINDDITALKRTALYIGNSYTDGVGSTSGSDGLFNLTKNLFYKAYKKTDGGIGFLQYTGHTNTFQTMLQNAINDSNIDNNEITDIIIISAWGDTRSLHEASSYDNYRADLHTALNNFYNTATTNFPNLKRIACCLGESRGQKVIDTSTVYDDAFWVHHYFAEFMPRNKIEYLGWIGFNIMGRNNFFSSDHYHPNNAGYSVLSAQLKTVLSGGNMSYIPIKKQFSGRAFKITPNAQCNAYVVITPEEASFNITSLALKAGSTPAFNTSFTLFDFNQSGFEFSLPLPCGQNSMIISNGFTCNTDGLATSDPANNFNCKLTLERNSTYPDSSIITCLPLCNSKTVSEDRAGYTIPSKISYNLSFFQ